jgi:alkanesulfonate monooxygenase SsuD/methylene tetrahydromethanopterin reductase-like flavin-dependent oxidoreductase (luciferase family)
MRLRFGVQTWSTDLAALRRYWRAVEDLGYDAVAYGDGLGRWTHDGWVVLGWLAAVTRRVRLGPAVTYAFDPSTHHPVWLAKRAVAVDHLSGGRLDLRIGVGPEAASVRRHWTAHAVRYPPAAERLARAAETIRILRALWEGEPVDHDGAYWTLRGAHLEPRPVQRPGPPVWISAVRPRTLALAARHGDGWEASYVSPERFAASWRAVERERAVAGRTGVPFRRGLEADVVVARSDAEAARALARFRAARGIPADDPLLATALAGTPDAVAARLADYVAAGVTDVLLGFADFPRTTMLRLFARDVLPRRTVT